MDAVLAMQIHTALLSTLVAIAFLFRLVIKQLGYSLHYKWLYERKIELHLRDTDKVSEDLRDSAYQRLMTSD